MKVVSVKGGLGNQLFQFAFAHTLKGDNTALNTNFFRLKRKGPNRPLEIQGLIERCGHLEEVEGKNRTLRIFSNFSFRILARLWENVKYRKIIECLGYIRDDPRQNVESSSKSKRDIFYADGYFQKNAYVDEAWSQIENEILPLIERNLCSTIKKFQIPSDYVVVHVRRADDIADLSSPMHIGILDDAYYASLLQELQRNFLVILTEERIHIEKLIGQMKPQLVLDRSDTDSWETLSLMVGAKIFVGSNSTLSWWGSKISVHFGNRAIMPEFFSQFGTVNTKDFYFEGLEQHSPIWFPTDRSVY
jgi:hypothetical protein